MKPGLNSSRSVDTPSAQASMKAVHSAGCSVATANDERDTSPNGRITVPFSSLSSNAAFANVCKNGQRYKPQLNRAHSCPDLKYDECREFEAFSGEWVDSKDQDVLISAWGVIRYPNNPKLRFEATYMGPNHLSVTFDKDPKRRKFVGKLNHECNVLVWSNETKWTKKGSKYDPRLSGSESSNSSVSKSEQRNTSCLIQ